MAATSAGSAMAQTATPDPTLLTTTLTPLGAERAGNADGSIPAWTGGNVTAPAPTNQPIDVPIFADEHALYSVDASNMEQYATLLTPGTQKLMTESGLKMNVFPTHRTAAAPQYVYDNTAKNVTRVQFDPAGMRFGVVGAYAGPPFPIINTSNPNIGGTQLVWNHLHRWQTFVNFTKLSGGYVVISDKVILSFGGSSHFICPYYDPAGTAETYGGYLSKLHEYFLLPSSSNGQEDLVWVSSNVNRYPNITWTLLNGQGRVRKAPDEAYDTPGSVSNGLSNYDDASGFAGSPQEYDWKYIEKREMLVPYHCNAIAFTTAADLIHPKFPNPDIIRWEKHRVWVVEATLHPGSKNTTARRRLYIDEDTWMVLLSDMYDANDALVKTAAVYNRSIGSVPCTWEIGEIIFNFTSGGDYSFVGSLKVPGYDNNEYLVPSSPGTFIAQDMAAQASF